MNRLDLIPGHFKLNNLARIDISFLNQPMPGNNDKQLPFRVVLMLPLLYACAISSLLFLVAAYSDTGLSTLSSVEYGTFLFVPYTDDEDAYTKCSTGLCLHASRML